jgi:hypothetical protein
VSALHGHRVINAAFVRFHRPIRPAVAIIAGLILLAAAYLRWTPLVPDLAAQVARANVVHQGGLTSWWTGWFGGLSLPSYSIVMPLSMAVLGVRVTGALAVLAGAVATTSLTRDTIRPRAAAIAFAVSAAADLLDGRVTFTAGLALASWALVALRARRPLTGAALAAFAYFASPLAALFLGCILVAVFLTVPSRRREATLGASALLALGATMALMFPDTGTMPFRVTDAIPAGCCCMAVLVFCRGPLVRIAAGIVLLAFPLFLLVPGAVGNNITRLAWVAAAPMIIACAPLPRRLLILTTAALLVWPISDLVIQVGAATHASAHQSFYEPLQTRLRADQAAAGPGAIGQRVELVDTKNHWGVVYLSDDALARGWDRQADNADNPIFYNPGSLTPDSYRSWLQDLAVGWVAVPNSPLDYASVREAKLIYTGLSYLTLVWSSHDWDLYRVVDSAPLVDGAQLRSVDGSGVTLVTASASIVAVRVRWSPYLIMRNPTTLLPVPGCVLDDAGWVQLYVPAAETLQLTSAFDPTLRLAPSGADCLAGFRRR